MGFNSSTHTIQTWRDGGAAPTRRSLKAGGLNIPPSPDMHFQSPFVPKKKLAQSQGRSKRQAQNGELGLVWSAWSGKE